MPAEDGAPSRFVEALVVGAGPAGLMAAERLALAGQEVTVIEAMPSPARKFLMAGKSGLNLTKDEAPDSFIARYNVSNPAFRDAMSCFGPREAIAFARDLGQPVFTGSTGRVFPRAMKASPLLRAWLARLERAGVRLLTRHRWLGWEGDDVVIAAPEGCCHLRAGRMVLACGGASWRRLGSDGVACDVLGAEGHETRAFRPANVGLRVDWSTHMRPRFGQWVKGTRLSAGGLASRGEWVIVPQGIEGGGVYEVSAAVRDGAPLKVDLVPDLTAAELGRRIARLPAKISRANGLRRLGLSDSARALAQEWGRNAPLSAIKELSVPHHGPADMDGAISTAGGLSWDALDGFMLRGRHGVFAAGEMLDWEAPTGGYLITACLATGRAAGDAAAAWREA